MIYNMRGIARGRVIWLTPIPRAWVKRASSKTKLNKVKQQFLPWRVASINKVELS